VWNNALLRSTSVRLSLVYAGLIVTSFVLAGVLIWLAARHTAEKALRQDIELEVLAIRTELQAEGPNAAVAAINARAEHPGALEYWLTDSNGKRLVGEFPDMDGPNGWHRVAVDEGRPGKRRRREEMLILTETLPGGSRLSVGDDFGRARAVQNAILRTLPSIGAIAVLLCLVVGVLVTRRVLSRMRALSTTFEKVAAGDIAARFPADGSGSDLEHIGAGVNRMLDRIEELITDVRRVSRDVAHDLRTPLTHLQQRLEEAKNEESAAGRIAAVEGAQQKAEEILKIFDAIVRLSEIEAGTGRQRFKTVDLAAIMERVVDAYRPDIEESNHSVEVTDLQPCSVLGDEDLLAQALANLIENAMHHTPAGTRITLRVFSSNRSRGFEVADNGPGIPAETYDVITKPFMRLDQSRTTPGSGLGLSLVAAIARLHGAQLSIADADPGLRVTITFG
jgi:signal transduction histidine kinase